MTSDAVTVSVGTRVRVRANGKLGTIIRAQGGFIRVQLDCEAWRGSFTSYPSRTALRFVEVVS